MEENKMISKNPEVINQIRNMNEFSAFTFNISLRLRLCHALWSSASITGRLQKVQSKCHPYWPPVGKTMTNGHLSVTVMEEKRLLAFISRTLSIMNQETEEKRTMFQFHFITWPDHGVPNPFQLVQFQRSVDQQQTSLPGPLVVHCSAGIGRTGTYIALDALLKHSQSSQTIDVYQYTLTMRKDRLNMIQTVEQYIALHDALDVSLSFPDTSIPKGRFGVDQDNRHHRIQDEFEALNKTKQAFVEKDYSIALSNANIPKNRSRDCIPVNRFRVRLKSPMEGRDDYINAVVLPSCSRSYGFLATQLPLEDTCVDFWRMVYDYNSQIVVLLDRPESDVQLLPEDDQSDLEIEVFKISMSGTIKDLGDTQEVDICLHKQQDKEKRQLKVLLTSVRDRDTNKIATRRLANAVSSTIRLEAARKTTAITVVCRDGKTNCVPFCLLKTVIERMDLDNTVDVFDAAREIQTRRPDTFNTMEDIRVIYQSLEEYIDSTSIYLNE
ncbi:Receptor-type tyrosine-protein phosphatase kappa [Mizuhopecten yessoensis]|uniref:Receptor-type tyrosine-protein phosphatase kappa n=1 Tax=Mizuhopecten yessoensis TaxID=6573 RepID=A0A210QF89_MIZYE|nr:Receptor-type tyrosine-protein phosphatase kappa [Mizuhopecten yessoensis]